MGRKVAVRCKKGRREKDDEKKSISNSRAINFKMTKTGLQHNQEMHHYFSTSANTKHPSNRESNLGWMALSLAMQSG